MAFQAVIFYVTSILFGFLVAYFLAFPVGLAILGGVIIYSLYMLYVTRDAELGAFFGLLVAWWSAVFTGSFFVTCVFVYSQILSFNLSWILR